MREHGVWREEGGKFKRLRVAWMRRWFEYTSWIDHDDLWNKPEIHDKAYTFLVLFTRSERRIATVSSGFSHGV